MQRGTLSINTNWHQTIHQFGRALFRFGGRRSFTASALVPVGLSMWNMWEENVTGTSIPRRIFIDSVTIIPSLFHIRILIYHKHYMNLINDSVVE